jgi:ribosomal protein S14
MPPAEITPFSAFEHELLDRGYEPGVPEPEYERERKVAESAQCAKCGAALSFVPLTQWAPEERHTAHVIVGVRSEFAIYRAFAVCRNCDTGTELQHVPL